MIKNDTGCPTQEIAAIFYISVVGYLKRLAYVNPYYG